MNDSIENKSNKVSYTFFWNDPLSYMPIIIAVIPIGGIIWIYFSLDTDQIGIMEIVIGLLLLSLLLVSISLIRIRMIRKLLTVGQSVKAVVDDYSYDQSYSRTSNTIKYHYEINGKTYKKKEAYSGTDIQKGEEVIIIYDPKNPKRAILAKKFNGINKNITEAGSE